MSTQFRSVKLERSNIVSVDSTSTLTSVYLYHGGVGDLPDDSSLTKLASGKDTLAMESIETPVNFERINNQILNGTAPAYAQSVFELEALDLVGQRILTRLQGRDLQFKVVEPTANHKLWALRSKRVDQVAAAIQQVFAGGVTQKSVSTYQKARRLYFKDSMVPRDEIAIAKISQLLGKSAHLLTFWGSAAMSSCWNSGTNIL